MRYMTLQKWIDHAEHETGEKIKEIVLYSTSKWGQATNPMPWDDKVLTIEELQKVAPEVLLGEFDAGYGGTEGPEFTAWSKNYVFFPDEYDGAESIQWMPRHPIVMKNFQRPGGG